MPCDDCVCLRRLSQAVGGRWLMVTILLRDLVSVQQSAQTQVGPRTPIRLDSGGLVPLCAQPCGQRRDAQERWPEQRASPDATFAADPRYAL